jgi:hypothetical protein
VLLSLLKFITLSRFSPFFSYVGKESGIMLIEIPKVPGQEGFISENLSFLKKLYNLKYGTNQIKDTFLLSRLLGFDDPHDCLTLEVELDAWLHRQLGVINTETLRWLCPECLRAYNEKNETIMIRDGDTGELCCSVCGSVIDDPCADVDPQSALSFDLTWAPENQMTANKLGTAMNTYEVWAITKKTNVNANFLTTEFKTLQKDLAALKFTDMALLDNLIHSVNSYLATPEGKENMRVCLMIFGRANSVRNATFVDPSLDRCLKYGFSLSRQVGLGDCSDTVFNNSLGSAIRKALVLKKCGFDVIPKVLVETCFAFTLKKFQKESLKYKIKLRVHQGLLTALLQFNMWMGKLSQSNLIYPTKA